MKIFKKGIAFAGMILLFGIFSCENVNSPTDTYSVSVSGTVLRLSNAKLDSVVVTLGNPLRSDTTKSDGVFNYTFSSNEANEVSTTLRLSRRDFFDTVFTVSYSSTKKSIALGNIVMRGVTSAIDSVLTGTPSSRAGTIILSSISSPTISIKGAGGIDASTLYFEVRDSLGIPVDENNKVTVKFKLLNRPDVLTSLNIDSMATNSSGTSSVILTAGQKSGIAQVQAFATVKNSSDPTKTDTIKSLIVSIPIYGGFPDSNHITIGSSRVNLPAGNSTFTSSISAVIGDKFGNPVQPGTQVYFETNGGIVSPGSTTTDATGKLNVTLSPTNPMPPSGVATVIASIGSGADGNIKSGNTSLSVLQRYTKSKNAGSGRIAKTASVMTTSVDVLFTGSTVVNSTDNNFVLSSNGTKNVSFTVSDPSGNPLASGTTISVTGIGLDSIGVVLNGDIAVTLPDTRDKSWTSFSVGLADLGSGNWTEGTKVGLSINVQSPNGNLKKTITGYLGQAPADTTGQPPSVRQPAQIAFAGITNTNIFVSGVGGTETSTLTYEVRDSLGIPIDLTRRAGVDFTLQFFPNSFTNVGTSPVLLPNSDSTDAQGRVHVTVVSGTQAGVVQITSRLTLPTKTLTSQPVKISVNAGFADQRHFTIAAPFYNFPGLQRAFTPNLTVTVGVTDKYSNPVIPGTQVYFHSVHGTITPGGLTNVGGFTTASLTPGNPYPRSPDTLAGFEPGYSKVYAQTIGENGTFVTDSILVLWTGAPVIVNTGVDTFTVANGGSRGPFTFKVTDIYGHPLSAGTTISVVAGAGTVTGATSTTLYDTFSTGEGITTFTVYLNDDNNQETDPPVSTDLRVQVTHPVYGKYELILATGSVD